MPEIAIDYQSLLRMHTPSAPTKLIISAEDQRFRRGREISIDTGMPMPEEIDDNLLFLLVEREGLEPAETLSKSISY
jgi:hypothetical protein